MSSKIEVPREFKAGFTDPVGDCGKFEASIDVDGWGARIAVYGDTAEDAEQLRAEVLAKIAAPVVERQPVAEVIATGGPHDREDRVLCELQAELPPIGTKLYASPPELAELQAAIAEQRQLLATRVEANETIARLTADLASANADKAAYAQNAIDLRTKLEKVKATSKQLAELDDGTIKDLGERLKGGVLPCDVRLPPHTTILKGCNVTTLLKSIELREGRAAIDCKFGAPVSVVLPKYRNERPFGNATTTAEYNEAKGFNMAINKVKEMNQ